MLTAIIAGILLFLFGMFIKGVFAHAMVILVAWLAKNGLLLAFVNTKVGRRMVRNVRLKAYAGAGDGVRRRRFYKVFKRIARGHEAVETTLRRVRVGAASIIRGPGPRPPRRPAMGKPIKPSPGYRR